MAPKHDKPLLWLVRQPQGLVPYSDYDRDVVERYRIGEHIDCYLYQSVDPMLTRRFHGMVGALAKGIDEDARGLRNRLMVQAGSVASITHVEGLGTTIYANKWSELEHTEAVEIEERVKRIILEKYLPGMPEDDLKRKIEAYIGVQP